MKAGKTKNTALLRTLATKDALNFATKRLLKDLHEVEQNTIPTVGVSAKPLDENLFIWHANIKGPEGTPYEGGVFHFRIEIPENYPTSPPTVTLFQTIPHPNIFDTKICLDMLESGREEQQGWTSGYTILSILIQLQSFLFANNYENDPVKIQAIKKAVQDHNDFKCKVKSCKHGGRLACFPPFNVKDSEVESFKLIESEKSLFEKELVCYHTKLNYSEVCLGIGLTISRVPRTGHIKQASCCLDYISIKAFIKEGIRRSVDNERFTNWLPLYFGGQDLDRALHLARKAISMIYTNNTRRFKEEMINDVFPKILLTLSFLMMDEKRHCSIRIIRLFTHIHCLYLAFLKAYPKAQEELEKKLKEFIGDEQKRRKDSVGNLGALLATLLVSDESNIKELTPLYFSEQLDRQVLWIIKQVPELIEEKSDKNLEERRSILTFKAEMVGYQILCFWKMVTNLVRDSGKLKNVNIMEIYQGNLGKLPNSIEDRIQQGCFTILKSINSYQNFFKYLDMEVKQDHEINEMLKQAIKNSKEKKYHGSDDEINTLPSPEEQMKNLEKDLPQLKDFILVEGDKVTKKKITEDQWKKACSDRFSWVRDILELKKNVSPSELLIVGRKLMKEGNERPEDRLQVLKNSRLNMDVKNWFSLPSIVENIDKKTTWEQLFVKLDIENHLVNMDYNPDFLNFYNKLKVFKNQVTSLIVPILNLTFLKSGYHYLTALLTQLTDLKNLEIIGLPNVTSFALSLKAFKCLAKGFNNFLKAGGKLDCLEYYNIQSVQGTVNELSEKIYQPILQMIELSSLTLSKNCLLNYNGGKNLGNFITVQKNLVELNLAYANINAQHAKELADGLMRAKQLQRLDLTGNTNIQAVGLSSIIYNLAFSPKLTYLNINNCGASASNAQVVESLYKLLRISGSLEILLFNNCGAINPLLTKEFYVSLGEIKTLKVLDISYSGQFANLANLNQLGMAIAFNAKKMGALEVVNMEGVIVNSQSISSLYSSMLISIADEENWYGDSSKVSKMSGEDFKKVYYNNLKILNFKKATNLASSFNLASHRKLYNPQDPEFVKLLKTSSNLVNLQLESCKLAKNDADLLTLAFDSKSSDFVSKIKILNLSRNLLGKEGAKIISTIFVHNNIIEVFDISNNKIGVAGAQAIAHALEKNTSVKVLNIFANTIDVDGARAFEKTLSVNSTLELIDFGHNRLRNEGLMAIAKGIFANKTSAVSHLALRFNFVTEDGFTEFLKKVLNNPKVALKEIYLKNNSINEYGIYNLKKIYDSLNIPIYLDIFDKIKYTETERLERTIWVSPRICSGPELKNFFEREIKAGLVLDIRERRGPVWPNRKQTENRFFFVEFAHATSVTRALHAASRKQTNINGQNFKIFKGGSGTYLYSRIKKKSASTSRTNPIRARGKPAREARFGRARGGFRGRGDRRG